MTNLLPARELLILVLKNYTSFFSPEIISELEKKGGTAEPNPRSLPYPYSNPYIFYEVVDIG
jgi:hypothetical protein